MENKVSGIFIKIKSVHQNTMGKYGNAQVIMIEKAMIASKKMH